MLPLFNFPFMGGTTTKSSENLGQNLTDEYRESQMYSSGQCSYYGSVYLHNERTEKVFLQFKQWAIEDEKRGGFFTAKERIDELLKNSIEIEVNKPSKTAIKASVGRRLSKGYGNNRGSSKNAAI